MSVQTEIDRIITAVGAAYDAVEAKGGTAPAAQTIEGLAGAISGIKSAPATPYMVVAEYEQEPVTAYESASYIKKAKLYNHTRIAAYEFAHQHLLQELDMSDPSNNITTIDTNAFADSMCENVIIPETVTLIGNSAFGAATIGTMILPGSVTRISDMAFTDVQGVNGVAPVIKLNEGLVAIGRSAFSSGFGYSAISGEMEIPSTVTEIGDYCFARTNITTVICKPTTPPALGTEAFTSETAGFTIKVPAASVAAYKAADGWKDYASYIVAM
nr:MAG TPA: leucine rich repeat protein [Caudoviricetes sp.]